MNVKISVIIPVFNNDSYLDTCITSVLKQTYQNFEIICINDNSTDRSSEILKKYAEKDKRIKILNNTKNMGPGHSRNKGIDNAKGKYIFFLDSDDWIDKTALKLLYNQCEKDKLDLIMFKYIVYYDDKKDFGYEKYYDMHYMNKFSKKVFNHLDLNPNEVFRLPIGPCNKLYNKSFLDNNNIRFPNENVIQEDNPFFFKAITLAKRISILNEYLYNRRKQPKSIMNTLNDDKLFGRIYIAELLITYFLKDKKLYNHYKKNLFNTISRYTLNDVYTLIKAEYKKEMYDSIHNFYIKLINEYNLQEDILVYVDDTLLKKFGLISD